MLLLPGLCPRAKRRAGAVGILWFLSSTHRRLADSVMMDSWEGAGTASIDVLGQ